MQVVAFGVSMPLSRFLEEVAPLFLWPMWPLLLLASVAQVALLRRAGVTNDSRAWKFGFVVLLTPIAALVIRVLFYLLGLPDVAPFARPTSQSMYVLTLSSSTVISAAAAYIGSTLACLAGRSSEA